MSKFELEYFEKYRPQSLEEIILPDRIRKIAEKGLSKNFIFYSTSGTGKTSLARILLNNYHHITLDGKIGVEEIREKVKNFCTLTNVFESNQDNPKVVYFEEFDRASKDAQEELKTFTEKYKHIRFLATCNNIGGLDQYLLSRFTIIDFTPLHNEIDTLKLEHSKRIYNCLVNDNINVEKSLIKNAIIKKYPDIRAAWNYVEVNIDNNIDLDIEYDESLYNNIFLNLSDIEMWDYLYANWIERYNLAFSLLGKQFVNYIRKEKPNMIDRLGATMKLLSDYTDIRLQHATDPFITLYSLYISYRNIYNK